MKKATPPEMTHRDAQLLDVLKTGFGLDSDAQVAAFLGITRTTIHSVRHGKARLGILQRLKILDHIGFLQSRQWLESLLPERLSERIRQSSQALAQRQARARQRLERALNVEGELLDLVQDACGFRTDTELADFLGVANILRGSRRSHRLEGYILPLLFFKRICDVWDEETPNGRDLRRGPSFPEHRFQVPKAATGETCARRRQRRRRPRQRHAEIERANPDTLYRVFGDADWGNKRSASPTSCSRT
jgi:hypothetical protein